MPSTATYKCKSCGDPFTARTADRQRGWAKFCSKSRKAKRQMKTHGDTREYAPGVSMKRARRDQREYGGIPQYHPTTGEYEGFCGQSPWDHGSGE